MDRPGKAATLAPANMVQEQATLERQLSLYKGLVEVSALINGITDHATLLPAILEVARRVFSAEVSSLFLRHENGELSLAASQGGPQVLRGKLIVPRGRGISGWVAEAASRSWCGTLTRMNAFFATSICRPDSARAPCSACR